MPRNDTTGKDTAAQRHAPYPARAPDAMSSTAHPLLSARSIAAKIDRRHLFLTDEQKRALDAEPTSEFTDILYSLDEADQLSAHALLASYDLDVDKRECSWSRWCTRNNRLSSKAEGGFRKVTYQCACGYDHAVKGYKKRHNPFNFTGCLGHAEVTYTPSKQVLRIRGYLRHNQGCKNAVLERMPKLPLHPSVFRFALQQLKDGATLSDIQDKNRTMFRNRSYPDMPAALGASPYRWLFQKYDTRTLYRQFNRFKGIDTQEQPQVNIDEWMDPASPKYNKTLAEAVFHYAARADRNERFEACVMTPEMREAAWKFAHMMQLILDGTFGFCDRKMLLFIAMAVDENNHGVPVAFFFFSAPGGNRQTSAGYDTEILTRLLSKWRASLGIRNGEAFAPLVAITDTDLKERGALVIVFTGIWLLICRFHLRQSWKNHRCKLLKGKSAAHAEMRARVRRLEEKLLSSVEYGEALAAISEEIQALNGFLGLPTHASAASKALKHVKDYLLGYWMSENLWRSWSSFAHTHAAELLQCPVASILKTTNHLESFNNVLKRKHLRRWQRGGKRLRLDVFFQLLVFQIVPSIFADRRLHAEEDARIAALISGIPGGAELLTQHQTSSAPIAPLQPVAYLVPDPARDAAAWELVQSRRVSPPQWGDHGVQYHVFSALATFYDSTYTSYSVFLAFDGSGGCECPDFVSRGGACKHMRAGMLATQAWRDMGHPIPAFDFPDCEATARLRRNPNPNHTSLSLPSEQQQPTFSSSTSAGGLRPLERAKRVVDEMVENCGDDTDGESSDSGSDTSSLDDGFAFSDVIADRPDSYEGLSAQIVSRVTYDLERLNPALRDLASLLANCRHSDLAPSMVEKLAAAGDCVSVLDSAFKKLLNPASPEHPHNPPCAPVPPPSPMRSHMPSRNAGPSRRRHLLAPSPEKSQRRKDSHAIH